MARVAVDRVLRAHPDAQISMYAASQELLVAHGLAAVRALPDRPWHLWGRLVRKWMRRAPPGQVGWQIPFRWPKLYLAVANFRGKVTEPSDVRRWVDEVRRADILVLCGQGALHDGSDRRFDRLCHLLLLARASAIPVVAVGQGIGPLESPDRQQLAGLTLRGLAGLGLRDGWRSVEVVRSLAVPEETWTLTGDDALALTVAVPVPDRRDSVGVSLRASTAAGVWTQLPELVAQAIEQAELGCGLELISMMEAPDVSDASELDRVRPRGVERRHRAATIDEALAGINGCRVVISGTYHAAVLAQGMGIPIIAFAANDYYRQKMNGLVEQFGGIAGTVLDPTAPDLVERLVAALVHWNGRSDEVADHLRAVGAEQSANGERFTVDRLKASVPGAARRVLDQAGP